MLIVLVPQSIPCTNRIAPPLASLQHQQYSESISFSGVETDDDGTWWPMPSTTRKLRTRIFFRKSGSCAAPAYVRSVTATPALCAFDTSTTHDATGTCVSAVPIVINNGIDVR